GHHICDMHGGARLDIRPQYAQFFGILIHGPDELISQCLNRNAALIGAIDDLVINVGNVAHVSNIKTGGPQPAVDHIEHHHHTRVAEMTIIVNRHATNIHADFAGNDRDKCLLFTGDGIIDFEHFSGGLSLTEL